MLNVSNKTIWLFFATIGLIVVVVGLLLAIVGGRGEVVDPVREAEIIRLYESTYGSDSWVVDPRRVALVSEPSSAAALRQIAKSSTAFSYIRANAVGDLSRHGSYETLYVLCEVLESDESDSVRVTAVLALGKIAASQEHLAKKAFTCLQRALEDEDGGVVAEAKELLLLAQ